MPYTICEIADVLAPSSLTFLPLPENTHSRLTTIPLSTVISISQPISEGAGANSAGYFPPNAAARCRRSPIIHVSFFSKKFILISHTLPMLLY